QLDDALLASHVDSSKGTLILLDFEIKHLGVSRRVSKQSKNMEQNSSLTIPSSWIMDVITLAAWHIRKQRNDLFFQNIIPTTINWRKAFIDDVNLETHRFSSSLKECRPKNHRYDDTGPGFERKPSIRQSSEMLALQSETGKLTFSKDITFPYSFLMFLLNSLLRTGNVENNFSTVTVVPTCRAVLLSLDTTPECSNSKWVPTGSSLVLVSTVSFPSAQSELRASPRNPKGKLGEEIPFEAAHLEVGGGDAASVVSDLEPLLAVGLEVDLDGGGAGVEAVLDELLGGGGEVEDDLA
ncbi:hypothetical protein EJB05_21054, partial [Eragrostis curvula]